MIIQQISIISTSTRKWIINSYTKINCSVVLILEKHLLISFANIFLMLTIRGIWLDKAVMRSQSVRGFRRHIDLMLFFSQHTSPEQQHH